MESKSKDSDAISTVTELISTPRRNQDETRHRKSLKRCKLSNSNRLESYIKNYEKHQTQDLAEMLTRDIPVVAPNKENEIQKEITLAKSLFGSSAESSVSDLQGLTTEDLLSIDHHTVAGFHKKTTPELSSRRPLSLKQPVFYSTPHKPGQENPANMTSPSPMKFSEIAATLRSEFDDVFGEDTSTDLSESKSNLFSLNGLSYTPHKEKYKTLWSDINHTKSRMSSGSSDVSESSNDIIASRTLTADAGRTPYRSSKKSRIDETSEDQESIASSLFSSVSESHYSVPFRVDGPPEMISFVKDCLSRESGVDTQSNVASGSVETLKNMLFTLQSVTLDSNQDAGVESGNKEGESNKDGHSSLKLAISHLSNLQHLLT